MANHGQTKERTMKKQMTAIAVGTALMLGTLTAAFAQGNGNAIGGGAAGGPNGVYNSKTTGGGSSGNNSGSGTSSGSSR
jgi:hypothetical protein